MRPESILFPMIALAALTFVVLLMIPFVRVRAVRAGQLTADDFKLGESARVPSEVSLPNRNYMNLTELPTLFYAACLALYASGHVDQASVLIAWLYVGLRCAHSAIHLTYNRVVHRLLAFAASNVVCGVLWIRLALAIL